MLTDEAMALGSVDFAKVKAEIEDLDASEKEELKAHLSAKFDIVDDKLELAIEKGIDILERAYSLVQESIALSKELKA